MSSLYNYSDSIAFGGFTERKQIDDSNWEIVNVSKKEFDNELHYPLNDGKYDGGNSMTEFANAVNSVRTHISESSPVFVHCAIGQSRSVSVLATALAAEENKSFGVMLDKLMSIRGSFTEPQESLQKLGKSYLEHNQYTEDHQ